MLSHLVCVLTALGNRHPPMDDEWRVVFIMVVCGWPLAIGVKGGGRTDYYDEIVECVFRREGLYPLIRCVSDQVYYAISKRARNDFWSGCLQSCHSSIEWFRPRSSSERKGGQHDFVAQLLVPSPFSSVMISLAIVVVLCVCAVCGCCLLLVTQISSNLCR